MSRQELAARQRITLRIEDVPKEWAVQVRHAARQLAMYLGRDVELWVDGEWFHIPARLERH